MKINISIIAATFVCLAYILPTKVSAQEQAKTPKVNKELKQIMKKLPADLQLQVLRYAERQKAAYMAAKIKKEELSSVSRTFDPEKVGEPAQVKPEKMAKPAPQKAVELKTTPEKATSYQAPPSANAPAAPPKPEYMRLAESMKQTQITWMEESFDFGDVKEGTKPSHIYKFKNAGENPLKITRVKPSCGCTTPNWSKEEIAPGEEGYIEVSYNSKNRPGPAHKSITVTGNFAERNKVLRFKVNVIREE